MTPEQTTYSWQGRNNPLWASNILRDPEKHTGLVRQLAIAILHRDGQLHPEIECDLCQRKDDTDL